MHTVLRSPVAHCELSPIELAWTKVKDYLRKNNQTFRLADLQKPTPAAFQSVTPEIWANCCRKAIDEENHFWETDELQEDAVEQFLIDLGVDDEDDTDNEEDDQIE